MNETNLKSKVISRAEVDKELERIRYNSLIKRGELLMNRDKAYREAFWDGYTLAREQFSEELDYLLSLGGIRNERDE